MNTINPALPRADGRLPGDLRPLGLQSGIAPACKGSALISFGDTRVICGASVDKGVPSWMKAQGVPGGWITAEYSMLPYSTKERNRRETMKPSGRTMEIQRLIGRSLRSAVDLMKLGANTLTLDCDVLQADGGTRTASITGAWIALRIAANRMLKEGLIAEDFVTEQVAAISVGMVGGRPLLDLCCTRTWPRRWTWKCCDDLQAGASSRCRARVRSRPSAGRSWTSCWTSPARDWRRFFSGSSTRVALAAG
ncbi:MAG: ribonuclease PH [Kiritimatiellia bacterium]